jgi:gamma-glutamylcyclotransferase
MELYFAYGSNMDSERFTERVGAARVGGIGSCLGYDLRFNKRSADGSGKANIVTMRDGEIEGVVFELSGAQLARMDKFEKGYHRERVSVVVGGSVQGAITYIADSDQIADDLLPTREYLTLILNGAARFGLSDAYHRRLRGMPSSPEIQRRP